MYRTSNSPHTAFSEVNTPFQTVYYRRTAFQWSKHVHQMSTCQTIYHRHIAFSVVKQVHQMPTCHNQHFR